MKIEMHTKDQDCTVLREDDEASRSRTKRSVGVREGKKVTTCAIIEEDGGNRLTCGTDTTKDPQMVQSFAAFLSELTK